MNNHTVRKPSFFDMLGHELRGPLFPIMALTDLLLTEDFATADPSELREQLGIIAASARELQHLIDDHVALGRLDEGRRIIEPGTTTLESVLHRSKQQLEDKPVSVKYDCDASAPVTVDAEALELVGACLLSFGSDEVAGDQTLSVSRDDSQVVLQIRAGPMSEQERDSLFTPFWRREDPSAPRTRAHGLKLALAARMAETCQGEVSAQAEGDHTLVRVTLPVG